MGSQRVGHDWAHTRYELPLWCKCLSLIREALGKYTNMLIVRVCSRYLPYSFLQISNTLCIKSIAYKKNKSLASKYYLKPSTFSHCEVTELKMNTACPKDGQKPEASFYIRWLMTKEQCKVFISCNTVFVYENNWQQYHPTTIPSSVILIKMSCHW